MPRAVVVGSGAGGATAAMALAEAGWDVVVLEKGRNYFGRVEDLLSPTPPTPFSNDELKDLRDFEDGSLVGGRTVHWDAKTPRFWDIDFKKLSLLGPVEGADVTDWPFEYAEIAPVYDEVEALIGVAGDVDAMPREPTLAHAPRGPFPMPALPGQYGSLRLAEGARRIGLWPFPFQMAANSVDGYDGRPRCNSCGFCSGFGCPIHARTGALAPLRRALRTGRVELWTEAVATRIVHNGRRACGVRVRRADGAEVTVPARLVVLAASAFASVRLAMLSEVPDPSGLLGTCIMGHWTTYAFAIFLTERLHGHRNRSTSHCLDDFCDPDFPGARAAARAAGLPYLRGGTLEMGGTQLPIAEARTYLQLLPVLSPGKPFGRRFKELMRASLLRDRLAGIAMVGEDLPQRTNRITLDADARDKDGLPRIRTHYLPHRHELAAQRFYLPWLAALCKAAGADVAAAIPGDTPEGEPGPVGTHGLAFSHNVGGMRMGAEPSRSVCDPHGRLWGLPNVGVADGAVFPTAGGHNPTLTIMAVALRNARAWAAG